MRPEWISRDEIRATIAAQLECPAADVADDDDLIQLGLNSIRMMALAGGWRKRGSSITFAQLAATPTIDSWYGLLGADKSTDAAEQLAAEAAESVGESVHIRNVPPEERLHVRFIKREQTVPQLSFCRQS